ncbi:hypothetical protein M7I_2010 [Glarea lozoyensis 74030]|uniref:Uncharacterized protein n=1 Tax=Glarea lozoyensis (strain ATCC 74030 / MF5533) TaxID=1104152 RepID=H0EHM6_GLAL7|nr:hypothetical protein M7I_2010 [Glarea lozoyensis 74030]
MLTEGDTATLGILQSDIEQLTRGVTVTSISPETQTQIKEALDLSGRAYETAAQQRILRSLSFVDMYGRFEAVDIAHYKTFEWIFEDKPEHTKNDYNFSHRETFLHWLSAGTGIFHISGKLGSGKSTLMKFLCSHERTSVELEKWAGDRKLVFAKFFFWKPGTTLQRSLGGLFRSLLHDTLETHPELIPAVLPDQWARNHCFCFFIDGLDEFEEPFKDSKDMINLLISWTEVAPEDVKICVSSREYNAFQDSFSDERRLCLQDLTRDDMERYIRDRLSDMRTKDKASIEPFAKAVARKANGIFLWTTLVVKSLRERLGDGYELDFLEQELDSIPEELEHLFKYLLRSIAKPARKSAYRTFAMVMEARTWELEISLASYYFFNHYETDKEFAMQPSFRIARPKEQSEAARRDMARKRLNGCCRGLLELSTHQGHFTIVFTHRSVPEFLESPETIIQMGLYLRNFSPIDAISQLFLAEVLMADSASMNIGSLSIRTYSVLRMLHQSKADWAPYHFRDTCLHTAVLELQGKDTKDPSLGYGRIIVKPDSYFTSIAGDYDESAVVSPLHISAFLGDYDYIAWKLGCDSTIIETDLKKYLLIRWIMHGAVRLIDSYISAKKSLD